MSWINTTFSKLLETSQSSKKQKQFGYLLLVVVFLFVAFDCYNNGFDFSAKIKSLMITFVCILLVTFVFKKVFQPFLFVWLLIGEILGAITSTVIMGVVYFLVFSPIVLFLKLIKKEATYKSEWKTVSKINDYTKLS